MALPKVNVFSARYIVERDEQFDGADHCLVMFPGGSVRHFNSPAEALRSIKRSEARCVGTGLNASVATIEWRDGLTPPK